MQLTNPEFDHTEIELVKACLESRWVTQGPLVRQFEQIMASRHQVRYACATTSCTAALHLATLSLGLGPGDEVIVPAFTWVTSAHCAEYVGATVKFADVNPRTFNLDPAAFEAAITGKTRAVVVVHLFGLAAEMDAIMAIAKKHSLRVIEDAACAIGTTYGGVPVGGMGDAGCFSFHPRKVITTGEGGMLTTSDERILELAQAYRCHGFSGYPPGDVNQNKPYTMGNFDYLGFNLRLSDIQAAIGVAQMAKLDHLLQERAFLAQRYYQLLGSVGELALPEIPPKCGHTYQSFVVRLCRHTTAKRNAVMDFLAARQIQTRPGTHAVHRLGYYTKKYQLKANDFPAAAQSEDTTITLPLFPGMSEKDQGVVVETLKAALSAC